jgi:hypothetical protein
MTVDALLNILLLVAVPGLMALIGGHLAAKALESRYERNLYRASFAFLFVVGIGLSIWQQVRTTNAEGLAKSQAHSAQIKAESDMQYLKGELNLLATLLAKQPIAGQEVPTKKIKPENNSAKSRTSYNKIREQLAIFFQEGENLKQRCLKEQTPPIEDANPIELDGFQA